MIEPLVIVAGVGLIGLVVVVAALLRAWQSWLDYKQTELAHAAPATATSGNQTHSGVGTARIEIADLKERIRKLEAIASGVEL